MQPRPSSLIASYRGLICDLDGVVYRGAEAVPGAVEALNSALDDGVGISFATNNAGRSPAIVADHLRSLGIAGDRWSVVNSSQAAASYLLDRFGTGARVLAVGGAGVGEALVEAGLRAVRLSELAESEPPVAVVQGIGPEVTWRELAEIAFRVQEGMAWVVTNLDLTLPTDRGRAPGNGALVAAVRAAAEIEPHAVGKPEPALFELSRDRIGTEPTQTLVCGDRLDTDIAGANAAGLDSLLVLTGVSGLRELAEAAPAQRPTYVAADLGGLHQPGVRLNVGDGGGGLSDAARVGGLPAVVATAWASVDAGDGLPDNRETWQELARLCR